MIKSSDIVKASPTLTKQTSDLLGTLSSSHTILNQQTKSSIISDVITSTDGKHVASTPCLCSEDSQRTKRQQDGGKINILYVSLGGISVLIILLLILIIIRQRQR